MIKHNQDGAANGVVISLIFCIILLAAALGVAGWAITGREDYKNNSDQKVAAAVKVAKQEQSAVKDRQFAEEAKNPLKTYSGPEAYGSLKVDFPKTWSGYVEDSGSGEGLVNGYFAPGTVPATNDENSVFALRIQVLNQQYSDILEQLGGQQQAGEMTISAYALPKQPKTVGIKAEGTNTDGKTVTMIVLPLRAQTLTFWTEGTQYVEDFNKYILPNFNFSP